MAEQVPVACDVLATIEARNRDRLAQLLHPEVHWTTAAEDEQPRRSPCSGIDQPVHKSHWDAHCLHAFDLAQVSPSR